MNKIVSLGPSMGRLIVPDDDAFRDHFHLSRKVQPRSFLHRLLAPKVAHASGWVDGEEVDILEDWFAGTARPLVQTHVSLFTTTPIDAGTGGVEGSWTGYARKAYARNGTNWGSSAGGAPSTIQNLVVLTFDEATAGSGTVLSWGYHTAVTAGTLLFFGVLDASKAIAAGDTPQFNAGDMVAKLGDPGDSF